MGANNLQSTQLETWQDIKTYLNALLNGHCLVCSFLSRVPPNVRGLRHEVFLSTKHGVEAKSYEGLGDANKLKPLEVELKRLEDLSESIVQVNRADISKGLLGSTADLAAAR